MKLDKLEIEFEDTGEGFIAYSKELSVTGEGTSRLLAAIGLFIQASNLERSLRESTEKRLSEDAFALLNRLQLLLAESGK